MRERIHQLGHSRVVPLLALALALGILGAAIFAGTIRLRRSLREQMVNRDGEILNAVALAQEFSSEGQSNLTTCLKNPAEQLALALKISEIEDGVLAVRLFDTTGKFVIAFPPNVSGGLLDPATISELNHLNPVCRYQRDGSLGEVFSAGVPGSVSTNRTPLTEVNIPIHARGEAPLIAIAQLIIDARNVEGELARLDRNLWRQALLAFLAGGGLLSAALVWAWRRVEKSNVMLQERTIRLLRANHELSLAARTGAVGAVTAHLVHGLSNPLANLQGLVAGRDANGVGDGEWQDLVTATRRMQQIVQDVVRVLGEETGVDNYEITFAELADILSGKIQAAAQAAGVACEVKTLTPGKLANRHANLVLLILENLTRNALQVTPRGRRVKVVFAGREDGVACEVADEGPGFPPELLEKMFTPCRSTQGGSGLGLAISQQLATQMGAKLELARTDAFGCVFRLTLPPVILATTLVEA